MHISKTLKLFRTQKGMSKTELAEKANLSISYLSLLEQGIIDPNLSTIDKLCVALSIPASIFMFLASDANELDGISKELAEKISLTTLQLMSSKN